MLLPAFPRTMKHLGLLPVAWHAVAGCVGQVGPQSLAHILRQLLLPVARHAVAGLLGQVGSQTFLAFWSS